ncbi:MAG: amidohydrolase [Clostridiales bacterium]|nr:amidohydrolase [Clostridiales bacterium]
MNILNEAKAERDYLVSLRRHLHSWPETAMQEQETARYIQTQLDAMGVAYRTVGETGILAQITGSGYAAVSEETGKKSTVLLRADIDALPVQEQTGLPFASQRPGFMHACGHDLHTAALIGAAKIIKAHENEIDGRVLLAFQPSEENGSGHRLFLEDPALLGVVDHAFGLHVAPEYPAGSIAVCDGADAAEVDWFTITIRGRSAHISKPSRGVDALYIAVQICQQLRALTTTLLDPM